MARNSLYMQNLESRTLLSAVMHPELQIAAPILNPQASTTPYGLTPSALRHGYGIDSIKFSNGTVTGDGSGQSIAIIDAYDDPNAAGDLHAFDQQFGLADPVFSKVNQ